MLFTVTTQGGQASSDQIATVALGVGLAISTMVALHSPAGSIANAVVVIGAAAFFSGDWLLTGALLLMAIGVVSYSIANARTMVASNRRRRRTRAGRPQGASLRR